MTPIQDGNATLVPSTNGLSVTIPSRKHWFAIIFVLIWLAGWATGYAFAGSTILGGFSLETSFEVFRAAWLVAWIIGGLFATGVALWLWFGTERFHVSGSRVTFERGIFGLGRKKELDRSRVRNIRYQPLESGTFNSINNLSTFGLGEGHIKFDYGTKTYSFGLGVDEAEARYLADRISAVL